MTPRERALQRLIDDPPERMLAPEQVAEEQAKNEARFQRVVAKAREA